jgi:hypothetical protein
MGGKPMRRLVVRSALAAALAIAPITAAPASAGHSSVLGLLHVARGGTTVSTYYAIAPLSDSFYCSSETSCAVIIPLGKRDYGRWVRWCAGVTTVYRTVSAGVSYSPVGFCQGPSAWSVNYAAALLDGSNVETTHGSPVVLTIVVTP